MANTSSFTVMTCNLRNCRASDGANSWDNNNGIGNRKKLVVEMIKQYRPDIIGTQEGWKIQLDYLSQNLEKYRWFGMSRGGEDVDDEYNAIFYNRETIQLQQGKHFWFSDTPDIPGSLTWGHDCKRMVTWAEFSVKGYPGTIFVFNTHFPLEYFPEAQKKSADLLVDVLKKIAPETPLFLLGDFNATSDSDVLLKFRHEGFESAWETADERVGPLITFHGFQGPEYEEGVKIDWILSRRSGAGKILRLETVAFQKNGRYPSDHFPVYAEVIP